MDEGNNKAAKNILWVYILLMLGVGGAILGGMVKIQWIDGAEWRERGNCRTERTQIDPAQRGNIYSSDGKILATTIPVCDLYIDMASWPLKDRKGDYVKDRHGNKIIGGTISDSCFYGALDSVCIVLHSVVPDKSIAYFRDRLLKGRRSSRPNRCYLVQRGIPYSAWMKICRFKGWNRGVVRTVTDEDGERSVIRQVRAHVYGNMGANVIGFSNSKGSYTGLEGFYDNNLRGQDGKYLYRRLTRSVWMKDKNARVPVDDGDDYTIDSVAGQKRIDGDDIVSTIDTRFQDMAESALRKQLARYGAKSGCAILMEVATGYVLACSSLVLDTTSKTYVEVMDHNIACSDLYEPGSTFKSVFLTAVFDDPQVKIDTATRVHTNKRVFSKYSGIISDDHEEEDTVVSLAKAMAASSNVGMSDLAWRYYRDRRGDLEKMVRGLLPYDAMMIDLRTSEPKGMINNLRADRNFLNFAYGYNSNLTALQMLTFYNALAAGGRMVKPLFCRAIGREGRMKEVKPVVLNERICSAETAHIMKNLLVGVVERGTGSNIKNNTYGIAGKTGTSTAWDAKTKQYIPNTYYASFAGFFPADKPKYSCIVVVKEVQGYGRTAAAPVFKKIADCVVAMDHEIGHIEYSAGQDDQAGKTARTGRTNRKVVGEGRVPDCGGMTLREARQVLRRAGYDVAASGGGRVVSQKPNADTPAAKGTKVSLRLQIEH